MTLADKNHLNTEAAELLSQFYNRHVQYFGHK